MRRDAQRLIEAAGDRFAVRQMTYTDTSNGRQILRVTIGRRMDNGTAYDLYDADFLADTGRFRECYTRWGSRYDGSSLALLVEDVSEGKDSR
jgi:hypothetical protein